MNSTNNEGSEITFRIGILGPEWRIFKVLFHVLQLINLWQIGIANPLRCRPGMELGGVRKEKGVLSKSPSNPTAYIFTFTGAVIMLRPTS